ncbi:anion permease [Nocardiopsis sp. HNM0947]|uniref:Anion permease n=1 Tax=Nocardiopsis coralli TaxID=2772213 RepID=A0ABR9P5U2_9ACTN|nr:SLC13 family permease [Nocardiopsis coralli]MBE2999216.1 anion permease [Nocardiopsis coralli]
MSIVWVPVLALVVIFVIAIAFPVNMGALAFVAAFLVGTLALSMSTAEIIAGFPGDLVLILIGVTYLFAIAQGNGTVDLLVRGAVRAVGGRAEALPWVMFFLSATLTAIGALSPAAVAIIAPIALGFAARHAINPLLMGAMVVHGAQAGSFSPISVYGGIVNGLEQNLPIASSTMTVFLLNFVFNLFFAFGLYLLLGNSRITAVVMRRVNGSTTRSATPVGAGVRSGGSGGDAGSVRPSDGSGPTTADGDDSELDGVGPKRISIDQALTLLGLATLIVLTVGFDMDLGFVAMSVAVTLAVLFPQSQKDAVSKISWSTVLLLAGVLTFVAVLEEAGTIDHVGSMVTGIQSAMLAAFLLCVIGAVVTVFASTTAMLGVVIPLAVPFLMQSDVSATAMVAALAIAITLTDISPFSTNGALVLANAKVSDPGQLYRSMLLYTGTLCVLAPLAAWGFIILPGSL